MQELTVENQMAISGGSISMWLIGIVIGVGLYKIFRSSRGRISISRLMSLEWSK